jgi:hypothetical protein
MSTVTVYINQESTTYSSIVNGLRIKLLQEHPVYHFCTFRIWCTFGIGKGSLPSKLQAPG